jgi:hypothetical protein
MVQLKFFREERLKSAWFSVLLSNPIRKMLLLIQQLRTLPYVASLLFHAACDGCAREENSGETDLSQLACCGEKDICLLASTF